MKKIIFTEKEDQTSYDPVSAFFGNKKAASVAKTNNLASTGFRNANGNLANEKKVSQVGPDINKNKQPVPQIPPKIGKKGEYNLPKTNKIIKKEESVYEMSPKITTEISQVNDQQIENKQSSKSIINPDPQTNNEKNYEIKAVNTKEDKSSKLSAKIKELEERQTQYLRKLQQYEEKEEKFIKMEQKLNKLQKQAKAASQKAKQQNDLFAIIKQKESSIKQLMQSKNIPFNRKRQVLMGNKIRQLSRLNRQLVLRLKNYKGTDLVELSIQRNRDQITKDVNDMSPGRQIEETRQMNVQMESFISRLINILNEYIAGRVLAKGKFNSWNEEQKFLAQIVHLSEKISLTYLEQYNLCSIPNTNEQCKDLFNQIQEYKAKSSMKKLIQRFDLNMKISEQNAEILNDLNQNNGDQSMIKSSITTMAVKQNKKANKTKVNALDFLRIYEKRSNFNQTLLVQSICQLSFLKNWIQKSHSRLMQSLNSLSKVIKQIKNIVDLGGQTAKQSLFLYIQTHIDDISDRFPNIKLQIKEIQSNFQQLQQMAPAISK